MIQMLKILGGNIIDTAAKTALEAPPSLNELHEGAHVCFAAIAT
jgi:hypothetical protein